jgi:hypothetical protein
LHPCRISRNDSNKVSYTSNICKAQRLYYLKKFLLSALSGVEKETCDN